MITIPVQIQPRPYEVRIENGLLAKAGPILREIVPQNAKLFVITVAPVRRRWGKVLQASLSTSGYATKCFEMPEGERFKRLATVERLAEKLSQGGADRDAVILAFGGGVAGDVGGLVASLFMRGVDVVQIPTTVLAQVDASIGGKTGVNLAAGKNLVGTFHQPRAVLIDPQVLSSLPEREYRAGLYEALKAGVIGDRDLFSEFESRQREIQQRHAATVERLIASSVKLKAEVVSADERENGVRRALNLGHTIGHALEAETEYKKLLHGEAVAWGLVGVARMAANLGRLDRSTADRIVGATLNLGKLPRVDVRPANIVKRLTADKKTRGGRVHFVLPVDIGKVEVADNVPEAAVRRALEEIRDLSRA
jgi:3-dehydroquinate synthase